MKTMLKVVLVAAFLAPFPALAHHSFAMFDLQKTVKLNASIVKFKWQNPHAFIEVDVPLPGGKSERWSVEMTSPNNLIQEGWKRTSIKPSDKVTLYIYPLRNGSKGGSFKGIRLPNGSTLGQAN